MTLLWGGEHIHTLILVLNLPHCGLVTQYGNKGINQIILPKILGLTHWGRPSPYAWRESASPACPGIAMWPPHSQHVSGERRHMATKPLEPHTMTYPQISYIPICCRADSRVAPSQWETVLLCNNVSHCLGASLESALCWHRRNRYWFRFIIQSKWSLHWLLVETGNTDLTWPGQSCIYSVSPIYRGWWGPSNGTAIQVRARYIRRLSWAQIRLHSLARCER